MAVLSFVHCDENVVVQALVDDDFELIQYLIDGVCVASSLVCPVFLETLALLAQVNFVPSLIHPNDVMDCPEMIKTTQHYLEDCMNL